MSWSEQVDAGNISFESGRLGEAADHYEAAIAAAAPTEPTLADVYENLALTYFFLGLLLPAERAFRRALDGDYASREQCLRFLIGCVIRLQRPGDGLVLMQIYEGAFGAHPDGWTQADVVDEIGRWRRKRTRMLPV